MKKARASTHCLAVQEDLIECPWVRNTRTVSSVVARDEKAFVQECDSGESSLAKFSTDGVPLLVSNQAEADECSIPVVIIFVLLRLAPRHFESSPFTLLLAVTSL